MGDYAVLHVARYPWVWRAFATLYSGFVLYLVLLQFDFVVSFWQQCNWIIRVLMTAAAAAAPVALMETFLTRTILSSEGIKHRSNIGVTTRKAYSDVSFIKYVEGETLTVHFSDTSKIKVAAPVADVERIMLLLEERAGRSVSTQVELSN